MVITHLSRAELEAITLVRSITPADFIGRFISKIREMVEVGREAGLDDDELIEELLGYYADMRHDFPTCFYLLARAMIRILVAEPADPSLVDSRAFPEFGVDEAGESAR